MSSHTILTFRSVCPAISQPRKNRESCQESQHLRASILKQSAVRNWKSGTSPTNLIGGNEGANEGGICKSIACSVLLFAISQIARSNGSYGGPFRGLSAKRFRVWRQILQNAARPVFLCDKSLWTQNYDSSLSICCCCSCWRRISICPLTLPFSIPPRFVDF